MKPRSRNLRIDPDFVVPEPTPATFFCTVGEEEFTPEFRQRLFDGWKAEGMKQVRVTLVNDEYPNPPYPHGVWIEGWTDEKAKMLPFGEGASPPLMSRKDPSQ